MKKNIFKPLILSGLFVFAASVCSASSIGRNIYGIYTETYEGMLIDVNNPGNPDGGGIGVYGEQSIGDDTTDVAEGQHCMKATSQNWAGGSPDGHFRGWWANFGYPSQVPTNMSAYNGGSIAFMVKTSTDVLIKIEYKEPSGTPDWRAVWLDYHFSNHSGVYLDNQWHQVDIPFSSFLAASDIKFSSITVPASFWVYWATYTWRIDNVVWKKPGFTTGDLSVSLKNRSDNSAATDLTWSGSFSTLKKTGWVASDQYLELDLTYYGDLSWGIQMYTDNKSAAANPQYTGVSGTNPAGLVPYFASMPYISSETLKMCWRVVDSTTSVLSIKQSFYSGKLYEETLGAGYNCFLYMKDRNTPTIASDNVTAFQNGEDYVTVWDNRGIQQAESTWSPARAKNYIYIGANFAPIFLGNQVTDTILYKTNTLRVELYHD